MKKTNLSILIFLTALAVSCQHSFYEKNKSWDFTYEAVQEAVHTMKQFRKTSPLLLDNQRLYFLNKFQSFSDSIENTTFRISGQYGRETDHHGKKDSHTLLLPGSFR